MVSCSGAPVSVQSRWNHHRRGSTPSATSPSSAARRRAAGASRSASVRRHVAVASRTETGSSNGPSGIGVHATPALVDEPRRGDRPVGVRLARGQHDAVLARPSTIRNSRRSSSRRARLRSDCEIGRSSAARSNIGSGRERLGKLPSTAPATTTVSSSRAHGAVRGQHPHGVGARVHRRDSPGPCSPASSACDERLGRRVGDSPASATTPESADHHVDLPARAGRTLGVGHQARRVRQVLPQDAERVEHRPVGDRRARVEHLAHGRRPLEASACVRPSVCSSAVGDRSRRPPAPRASARAPTPATAGTRSDVSTDSIELLPRLGVGGQPPQRQHVRERGGLGRERQAALGERARDAARRRARAAAPRRARPAAARPRELAPRHALLHVEPAELAGDRRVLLRRVRRDPRLDGRRRRCRAMRRRELDDVRAARTARRSAGSARRSFPGTRRRARRGRRRRPGPAAPSPATSASAANVVSW